MPSVLAIAAHPDDIEFGMCGTMLQLKQRGWDLHYMNVADGSRGSTKLSPKECAAKRLEEGREAASRMGATFYPPVGRDMEMAYTTELFQKVAAVVRQSRASIVLTHSPQDYMEDHEFVCRLAVSAAFAHGMPNFETLPPVEPYYEPVTVYHAQPVGNRLPLGQRVRPHFWVDIEAVMDGKREALEAHESQREWLDASQGMDSYIQTMIDMSADCGQMSGKFQMAEGWRRREHWGFCNADDDPLREALSDILVEDTPRDP